LSSDRDDPTHEGRGETETTAGIDEMNGADRSESSGPGEERVELPRSPRSGTTWELEVEELAPDARGVARLPALVGPQREPKNFRFRIRKAVPGDTVEATVERRRGERIDARMDRLVEASPDRVEPRCRHFGRRELADEGCGGCSLQSLPYAHQLAAKERAVKSFLIERGVETAAVEPIVGQDEPWRYRNKMEFSFGDTAEREFALGLHPRGYRHEIVNLGECFLQSEFTSEFVPAVRAWARDLGLEPYLNSRDEGFLRTMTVREGKRTGERLVDLMTTHDEETEMEGDRVPAREVAEAFAGFVEAFAADRSAEVTSVYWTQKRAIQGQPTEWIGHRMAGKEVLEEQLHLPGGETLTFEIGPRAFFQPNTRQAERLYREVLERAGLIGAGGEPRSALDLYCGTGTIALALAPYADRVAGVEMQADAVENARRNAEDNGIEHATFFTGDVADVLESDRFREAFDAVDLVVVDPPRAGLQPDARDQVDGAGAPGLVYVSCNPEALARDLDDLVDRGYQIEKIQPIDMFPQTYHVECVAELVR